MRIIVAPDKFKGSLSAQKVCEAIEIGIKKLDSSIEVIKHPLADGGEGTLDILQNYYSLTNVTVEVQNPIFQYIKANYLITKDKSTAYIEMANASGLQLLKKHDQNCFHTSTIGTGQLIQNALENGAKHIILFIGGSATNDAGIGMATALGYKFYNTNGCLIKPIGKELLNIAKINSKDVTIDFSNINFTVVCDVKNPLYGKNGAAHTYGIQKGASIDEIDLLNLGLINFSNKVKKYLNKSVDDIEGGGAAGGLGAGAVCFLNAKIQTGIDFVLEQTNFKNHLKTKVDFIITGEGSVDKQTLEGKVVKGISDISIKNNIPFAIMCGVSKNKTLLQKKLKPHSINSIMELGISFDDSIENAYKHLSKLSYSLIKTIKKAN